MQKEMATHSSTLAWKIPWTGSLVGYNLWVHRVGHTEGLPLHFLNLIKSTQRTELPLLVITGQVWDPQNKNDGSLLRLPTRRESYVSHRSHSCQSTHSILPSSKGENSHQLRAVLLLEQQLVESKCSSMKSSLANILNSVHSPVYSLIHNKEKLSEQMVSYPAIPLSILHKQTYSAHQAIFLCIMV